MAAAGPELTEDVATLRAMLHALDIQRRHARTSIDRREAATLRRRVVVRLALLESEAAA